MKVNVEGLLRPHIKNIKPYSSARDEYTGMEGVFLDANENPFGSVAGGLYNRYPDPYQKEVKDKLAKIKGIGPEYIFLGNGSDEPIDLLVRMFCEPGKDNIIITPPTYGMYQVSADINHIEVLSCPLEEGFHLNAEKVLQLQNGNTKIIFLCSPNNPSGNSLRKEEILKVIEGSQAIVVLDEAYIDFSKEESFVPLVKKYNNLVVLQTFSKAWGLASLRLGMAFTNGEIIKYLNKIKPPYNINGATQQLALLALANYDKKDKMVADILNFRKALEMELSGLPFVHKVYPSEANFLLVKMDNPVKVYQYLIDHKIIVRDRSKVMLCEGSLRITVGTKEENEKLIAALKNYE